MAEACYVPQFLPASFKGFAFEATMASSAGGRRGAEGQFPFGESTAYQDMGRQIRTWALKARFVTNDHVAQAAALIAVCESPGPGTLVHPTRGVLQAACKSVKASDNLLEGYGETTVDLEFVEASSNSAAQSIFIAGVAISGFVADIAANFQAGYQPAAAPFYDTAKVTATAAAALSSFAAQLPAAIGPGAATPAWSAVSTLKLTAASASALAAPATVSAALQTGAAALDRYATTPAVAFAGFRAVANSQAGAAPATLAQATQDAQNAVFQNVRLLCAAYMAREAAQNPAGSVGAALAQMDVVLAILDQEAALAATACEDELYLQIRAFRSSTFQALFTAALQLPPTVKVNFGRQVCSQVAAYLLYGDATQFGQIEAANPGTSPFIIGPAFNAPKLSA